MKSFLILVLLTLFTSAGAFQSPSAEKIRLDLSNTIVTENGKAVIEVGGKCGGGQVLAFHLPPKGWYVVSVEPFEGYDFQKIGKLNGNKISFQYDNSNFEIVSDQPFSRQAETLDLWVVRIGPPADKTQDKRTSCATDFKYWLETTLLKDEKK
jgi:hypothetical protein